jgi:hypothetical protein
MSTAVMKKPSKKIKLTDPKFNQEPPAGSIVLNFESGTTLPEQIEEVTDKVKSWTAPQITEAAAEPAPESKTEVKAKSKTPKAAPEPAPASTAHFNLDAFLRDNLVSQEGQKKVTTLDIVEKYAAAAKAAGESAHPKFQVQRMLRALMLKNFLAAVYSNSTPNGFKGVVWKSLPEGTKAQLKSR